MRIVPVVFIWREVDVVDEHGEATRQWAMVPLPRYARLSRKQYAENEEHTLEPLTFRDMRRHNHFFAAVGEAFKNLPETVSARWPTSEHFRKWVLVECGYFDEKEFDCPDEEFAKRLAFFVRSEDEYARISVHRMENPTPKCAFKVIVRRAKSQGLASMKPEEFYQSKKDVLDYVSGMVGVTSTELKKNARKSA